MKNFFGIFAFFIFVFAALGVGITSGFAANKVVALETQNTEEETTSSEDSSNEEAENTSIKDILEKWSREFAQKWPNQLKFWFKNTVTWEEITEKEECGWFWCKTKKSLKDITTQKELKIDLALFSEDDGDTNNEETNKMEGFIEDYIKGRYLEWEYYLSSTDQKKWKATKFREKLEWGWDKGKNADNSQTLKIGTGEAKWEKFKKGDEDEKKQNSEFLDYLFQKFFDKQNKEFTNNKKKLDDKWTEIKTKLSNYSGFQSDSVEIDSETYNLDDLWNKVSTDDDGSVFRDDALTQLQTLVKNKIAWKQIKTALDSANTNTLNNLWNAIQLYLSNYPNLAPASIKFKGNHYPIDKLFAQKDNPDAGSALPTNAKTQLQALVNAEMTTLNQMQDALTNAETQRYVKELWKTVEPILNKYRIIDEWKGKELWNEDKRTVWDIFWSNNRRKIAKQIGEMKNWKEEDLLELFLKTKDEEAQNTKEQIEKLANVEDKYHNVEQTKNNLSQIRIYADQFEQFTQKVWTDAKKKLDQKLEEKEVGVENVTEEQFYDIFMEILNELLPNSGQKVVIQEAIGRLKREKGKWEEITGVHQKIIAKKNQFQIIRLKKLKWENEDWFVEPLLAEKETSKLSDYQISWLSKTNQKDIDKIFDDEINRQLKDSWKVFQDQLTILKKYQIQTLEITIEGKKEKLNLSELIKNAKKEKPSLIKDENSLKTLVKMTKLTKGAFASAISEHIKAKIKTESTDLVENKTSKNRTPIIVAGVAGTLSVGTGTIWFFLRRKHH